LEGLCPAGVENLYNTRGKGWVVLKLTAEEIVKAAGEGRVNLTAAEEAEVQHQSLNILALLDAVPGESLNEIPAACYGHKQPGSTRQDTREPSLPLAAVLHNAADTDDYCFHVPRIVES